jgi:SAM-dependent methyltransferase
VIVEPQRPTFRRWRKLRSSPHSLLRTLQYERLASLDVRGRVLDVGGGERADYRSLVRGEPDLVSVNIDSSMRPSFLVDLNRGLPFRDRSFEGAISLNTFEHLAEDRIALAELLRVLRPGAPFHIFVPFLFKVHGSPSDYQRRTAHWWTMELRSNGLTDEEFLVEPLVWDPLATALSVIEMPVFRRVIRPVFMLRAPVGDLLRRSPPRVGRWSDYTIGYYVSGSRGG